MNITPISLWFMALITIVFMGVINQLTSLGGPTNFQGLSLTLGFEILGMFSYTLRVPNMMTTVGQGFKRSFHSLCVHCTTSSALSGPLTLTFQKSVILSSKKKQSWCRFSSARYYLSVNYHEYDIYIYTGYIHIIYHQI